ncbi:MAG: hypothetical protein NTV21_09180 [Planctomycetota bacterium]|nr:hypothetical protein [Planctomycetota bacterium]
MRPCDFTNSSSPWQRAQVSATSLGDTCEAALSVAEMPCSLWQSVHTGTSAEPVLKASPCTPPR